VTPYIWKNPVVFRFSILPAKDLSKLAGRWTTKGPRYHEDTKVWADLFHMDDVLEFLEKNPGLSG
jgi:spore coat polysaccharide biosynthesis protein SpsF (cytidylyltransferase family)